MTKEQIDALIDYIDEAIDKATNEYFSEGCQMGEDPETKLRRLLEETS